MSDPLFGNDTLVEGLRLGASMELDLRVRRDGGFVVLHDATLDCETTGSGAVADQAAEDLRNIFLVDARQGEPSGALMLSENLATNLRQAHPQALLQFDMKDDLAAIGPAGLDHLTEWFADPPCPIIVSGDSLELIAEIKDRLPGLRRGIDPTDRLVERYRRGGIKAVETALRADLAGPTEPDTVYLAWQLILQASRNGLDLVGICHGEGKLVDAWTFNLSDPATGFSDEEWETFSALLALEVDQITTDEALATEQAYRKR
jgi:glycerophosphoryl diester phosphodiesterase